MKFKVKGLVFVGFAAAILSANAALADPDNTVTSKSYVDNKFQTIANLSQQGDLTGNQLNANSDTTYPSEKMVAAALTATGNSIGDGTIDVQLNGTSKGTFTVNQDGDTTINVNGVEVTSNKTQTIDSNSTSTEYPSAAAVYGALYDGTNNHDRYQAYSGTANQISDGNGGWKALDSVIDGTTASSTAAPTTAAVKTYVDTQAASAAGDILTGTQSTTDTTHALTNAATTTALNGKEDASNKVTSMDSQSTDAQYPSAKAVYDALHNTANVGNGTIDVQLNGTSKGTFTVNQAGDATINVNGVEVTSNKLTQGSATGSVLTTSDTQYPTSNAVKTAIEAATGGNTIPVQDGTLCDSTHPCALINNNGTLTWQRIAQAGD